MFCDKSTYKCVNNPATIVTCQTIEDTDCVNNTCNPLTGKCKLQNAKDGLICEDGDKLTMGDTCVGGVCKGIFSGECRNNSDCKDEDNDLCTGTPYCDKATAKCVLNPITVVTCQTVDDTACLKNTCQPSTGECQFKTVNEGGICSDFNLCTFGDVCQLGKCVGKEVVC